VQGRTTNFFGGCGWGEAHPQRLNLVGTRSCASHSSLAINSRKPFFFPVKLRGCVRSTRIACVSPRGGMGISKAVIFLACEVLIGLGV
jgi:hypothetical protein